MNALFSSRLVSMYRKLPVKPFRGILGRWYEGYRSLRKGKVVVERGGVTWELDLTQGADNGIYYEGFSDSISRAIRKLVREGMTIFDIGANIGIYALQLARLTGPAGRVIAIEPIGWAVDKLRRTLELNNLTNVTVEKLALSNRSVENQDVEFYASWPYDLSSNRDPVHGTGQKIKDKVDFITLDDYVRREGIKKIDLIKLDVDGYEYRIIQGAADSLKRLRPLMIVELCRGTLEEAGYNVEGVVDLLLSLDYSIFTLKFKAYRDREALLASVPADGHIDVLCIPRDKNKPINSKAWREELDEDN